MKHYITVTAALLLSAILIFNPAANAASVTHSLSMPSSVRCSLINQYIPPYDSTDNPRGDIALYTYEYSFEVVGVLSGGTDSYINGVATSTITLGYQIPAGYTLQAFPHSYETAYTDHYITIMNGGSAWNTQTVYARTIFSNYFTSSTIFGICTISGTITVSKPITPSNLPDPPEYINVTISGSTSSTLSGSVNPTETSMVQEVAQAIISAVSSKDTPFPDILTALEDIRTQDQTAYTQIVAYLSDNDTFNSTLYTWLTTVLEDDFSALLDDTTYISAVLNAARNLISNMNSRDSTWYPIFDASIQLVANKLQTLIDLQTAAASQADQVETAAAGLEQQIQAANNYSQPDVEFMLTQADSIWVNGQSGVNLIATIINEPWIVQILLTVISLAFVGYLLYGKGV